MPLDMVLHCCYRNKFINIFKEDDVLFKRSEGDATVEELEDIHSINVRAINLQDSHLRRNPFKRPDIKIVMYRAVAHTLHSSFALAPTRNLNKNQFTATIP